MTFDMLTGLRFRKSASAFTPNTMIDNLFDYPAFYGPDFNISADPGSLKGKNIAIAGAGAAGLMAAYLLAKAGASVDIFEASDRIGGRMCSVQYGSKETHAVFELGCMRFPPSSSTLWSLFRKFGIQTQAGFPDPGTGTVYTQLYYQNQSINWFPPKEAGGHSLPEDPLFQRLGASFGNMLVYLVGDPNNVGADPSKLYYHWNAYQNAGGPRKAVIDCWQKLVDAYKDVSFVQAIYTLGQNQQAVGSDAKGKAYPLWTLDDMNAFGALGVGSGGFGPLFDLGFLEILRVLVNGFEDNQELVPAGIGTLAEAMTKELKTLGVKFYLNCPVEFMTRFHYTPPVPPKDSTFGSGLVQFYVPGNPNVHDREIAALQKTKLGVRGKDYDGMVMAMTSRAMQMTGITSKAETRAYPLSLDTPIKTAIRSLHMTSSSKFFVRVKEKFWLQRNETDTGFIYPSNIQSDEIFRGLYCLDYAPDAKNPVKSGGGVVLISYTWEDDSTKLMGLSKRERYAQFLRALTAANSGFAEALDKNAIPASFDDVHEDYDLTKTNMVDWQAQPYYYGAFKLDQPGQEQLCHDAVYQFQTGREFAICGDSISWVGGWMEGALTSAVHAACAVAAANGAKLKPDSPMEKVTAGMYDYAAKVKTTVF